MRIIDHHIAGQPVAAGSRSSPVYDPNTGRVQAEVRLAGRDLLDQAVAAARAAQPAWAATNPQRR
uniref:aldehyde dehydrogenase family protein n=1 Tax=Sandarakinorhabdus rubra TaxID=2672568 RepID=UPI0013DBE120